MFSFNLFLSKLLTYCVLRSTQPPTLNNMGNEYSLQQFGELWFTHDKMILTFVSLAYALKFNIILAVVNILCS